VVGLRNHRQIVTDPSVLSGLGFTLLYAVATTLIVTVLAIPLAVILGLVWTFVPSPLSSGVINSVLGSLFGVGPVPWLPDNTLAKVSVIVVEVRAQTGWHAVLYLITLTGGGPGYDTCTITQVLVQRGIAEGDYGLGAALGVIFLSRSPPCCPSSSR
jgi:multiple sugar transport system permease protein/raffinose/stachyose/melibiose transport system permease protein